MTLNQLETAVTMLGFEKELEDTDALIVAANRALRIIFTERPVIKRVWISTAVPQITSKIDMAIHEGNKKISFELTGKAYSFKVCGCGEYTISDNDGKRTESFNGSCTVVRGFINGRGTITFSGEYFYTVHGLCCFASILSDSTEDIPVFEPVRSIDVAQKFPDFMSFSKLPENSLGNPEASVYLSEGKIVLPWDYKDEIYIEYHRAPEPISKSMPNLPIDIPAETAEFLPLLTAAFLWLDDDPEKAQYYMALYRDSMSTVRRYSNNSINNSYSVNGWA